MSTSRLNDGQPPQGIDLATNGVGDWAQVPENLYAGDFEADLSEILERVDDTVDKRGNMGGEAVTTGHHEVNDYSNQGHSSVPRTISWTCIPTIDQYPPSLYQDDIASTKSNQGSYYRNPTVADLTSTHQAASMNLHQTTTSQHTSKETKSQSPRLILPSGSYDDSPLGRWAKTYERHEAMGIPKALYKSREGK